MILRLLRSSRELCNNVLRCHLRLLHCQRPSSNLLPPSGTRYLRLFVTIAVAQDITLVIAWHVSDHIQIAPISTPTLGNTDNSDVCDSIRIYTLFLLLYFTALYRDLVMSGVSLTVILSRNVTIIITNKWNYQLTSQCVIFTSLFMYGSSLVYTGDHDVRCSLLPHVPAFSCYTGLPLSGVRTVFRCAAHDFQHISVHSPPRPTRYVK
jgi:hypothetical protein